MAEQQYTINDWDLTTANMHRISQHQYQVAVLPVGATEPHNRHLPEGVDILHTTIIAKKCCQLAWEKCKSVICLPSVPYGVDCNLLEFPLAIHISQSTLDMIVREVITSLRKHDIRKIVIFNGHGGNDFKPLIRQIQTEMDVFVFLCDWWKAALDKYNEIFNKPDDHAGQFETSVALALFPQLVEIENAGDGVPKPFRFKALQAGHVTTSRDFSRIGENCAAGDPEGASADKGREYIDLVVERVADFLTELAAAEIDDSFPHIS